MATFLLSVLIFGSAGAIVYTRLKSGKNCDDCQTACPVKKEQIKRCSVVARVCSPLFCLFC